MNRSHAGIPARIGIRIVLFARMPAYAAAGRRRRTAAVRTAIRENLIESARKPITYQAREPKRLGTKK